MGWQIGETVLAWPVTGANLENRMTPSDGPLKAGLLQKQTHSFAGAHHCDRAMKESFLPLTLIAKRAGMSEPLRRLELRKRHPWGLHSDYFKS